MAFCKHRVMDKCKKDGRPCFYSEDCFEPEEEKPLTNADRIQAMSIEEKATYFRCPRDLDSSFVCLDKSCDACVIKWLQQPAE